MSSSDVRTSTAAGSPGLREVARDLESAQSDDARTHSARLLLAAARQACIDPVDLSGLTRAADALLHVVEGDSSEELLNPIAHEFIDLARHKSVRLAAYPAESGTPGGEWIDRIVRLIDRTDFTVGRMFRQRAAQNPQKTLFTVPKGDQVSEYSFERVSELTQQIARSLLAVMGDAPRVAIYTPNRIEGALVDLACLTTGIFNTLVPANAVESQLQHILAESQARVLVVSGSEQLQKGMAVRDAFPSLEWIITLDALPTVRSDKVMSFHELCERAREVSGAVLEERLGQVRSSDTATTMYTSGTTGVPKGIKFSQLNLVSKRYARAAALPHIDENEVFLCFLPLYHTFGRYLEMLAAVHLAATYVFAESASTETLIQNMRRFHPTAMISVPKKWVDLYRRVMTTDEPPDNPAAVEQALRDLTGGQLRWGLSAAGRLDPAIFRFFQHHNIDLLSGYGMTEATGGITMTPPGKYVEDSIGKALPAIELEFGEDDELKLRGPYVSDGYTDPEDNAAAFQDGWFCTGDIVSVDSAGFIRHVDRKKDIYKNASGRTIAPQRVEALFADFPEVSRVFAVGDGRDYVTLLIRPNTEYTEIEFGSMSEAAMLEYFRGLVIPCNRFLAPFERVVNFTLIDRDFSLEKGELTQKGSFRRAAVEENFRDVIEPMYASSTINRTLDGLVVKIPVTFLQHLGATEAGTQAEPDGVLFLATDDKLTIRRDSAGDDRVWIGNCCYEGVGSVIELDDWFRFPKLWVGNAELTRMSGDSILLWSLPTADRVPQSKMVWVGPATMDLHEHVERLESARSGTASLLTVHAAAVCLFGGSPDVALQSVDYLTRVLGAGWVRYQELAEAHLRSASRHHDPAVRGRAFAALFEHEPVESFDQTAEAYCESSLGFLSDEACERMAELDFSQRRWQLLCDAFSSLRQRVAGTTYRGPIGRAQATSAEIPPGVEFAVDLIRSLGKIADAQESYYLPVRRELMAWMLAPVSDFIHDAAGEVVEELTLAFRRRLGNRRMHAVDPASNLQYDWSDTLRFEEGINPDELSRLSGALCRTNLIREAVFLLHHNREIDLADLSPGSIWISLTGTRFGRSVYQVGVRLRSGERYDFMLHLRGTAEIDTFLTDIRLMCLAAGAEGETRLTPQLGGYWPEYGLATVSYISAESVEGTARHMHEHPDRTVRQRLNESWRHLCWSTLTAAFEFYRRTEGRWMLTGSIARFISVQLNDFDERTRVFSMAGWRPFESRSDMILGLKHGFLDRVRFHFPALAPETRDDLLFAAALEALGTRKGGEFLRGATDEVECMDAPTEEMKALCRGMKEWLKETEESGYMPKGLFFAIARYHAWSKQVQDARTHAKAAQLRELQNNYHVDDVERRFPGSRLWLYADTVLQHSPDEGRRSIEHAIERLRAGDDIKDVLGRLYQELKDKLPSHDQQYFLTRAAYPHLELDEKAELVTTSEAGPGRAELVTTHADRTGAELRVRPVSDPREVDKLHRIFYVGGLRGGYLKQEKLLVAVDSMGYVVGGVGYIRRTPSHALLEKIAVLPRCRGRGIGELLVHEFLRRQTAEEVAIVSAEFIRASWLSQFGFKSHPRYAGVVYETGSAD
ncbi:MAG: GNAT family N-acetyltransferase [Phycisphaerales bacterium]|nr:MAG: GNAT family N-acetyltransferase [Phycisphaerales bacterium]